MNLTQLRTLMGGVESDQLEFKEARTSFSVFGGEKKIRRSLLGYCVGIGNIGGGKLVLGVTDVIPREIVGTSALPDPEAVKVQIYGKLGRRINIEEVYDEVGKRVVVIEIPRRPVGQPFKFNGIYLMRVGEELRDMDEGTLSKIMSESAPDWSAGICEDTSIEDLAHEAISVARNNFKMKHPKLSDDVDDWDDKTFLTKAKLLNRGRVTNAAILLLGKPESTTLISPAVAQIVWILRGEDGVEKDYEHFGPPFLLAVDKIHNKIRNLKYRYIKGDSLFPDEVDKYAPYIIREALNNCIAHQDYSLNGRIQIIEREDSLLFTNKGDFLPGTVRNVITSDSPQEYYRNKFLADAMVNLNMIDTVGSGIKKMFRLQRDRFFPLPSYDLSDNKVVVSIIGKVLDINYAKILARNRDLNLDEIIFLDRIQKHKRITKDEAGHLRAKKLIEGRYPNIHFSKGMAAHTGEKAQYIRDKGFESSYYKDLILKCLDRYPGSSRKDIDDLLMNKLPEILNDAQKRAKIGYLLFSLSKTEGKIVNKGTTHNPKWYKLNN